MFNKFESDFKVTAKNPKVSSGDISSNVEIYASGFSELMEKYAGSTFNNGLYRLHNEADILKWTNVVEHTFPEYKGRVVCFGYDWLGRNFALDKARVDNNQMQILLFEPGTGEVFQIPANFSEFHNVELAEYSNEALASEFFSDWLEQVGKEPEHSECVSYKVPLFLSGRDTLDNLEICDMEVYWSICEQALNAES